MYYIDKIWSRICMIMCCICLLPLFPLVFSLGMLSTIPRFKKFAESAYEGSLEVGKIIILFFTRKKKT